MTRLNNGLTRVLAAIYLFLIAAAAQKPVNAAPDSAPAPRPNNSQVVHKSDTARPFLWKVDGPRPCWLFGTIHSNDPGVATLPASVTAALDGCRTFHPEIEIAPDMALVLLAKMFQPDTPDLSSRIPPALWTRVKKAGGALGLPESLLERLTPGLAALLFSAPPDTDIAGTVDGQLHDRAVARGLTVTALETLDEQLGVFEKLPDAEAIAALTDAFDEADAGRPTEKKLLDAYASGDERAVVAVVETEFAASPATRALAEPLLYHRNELMAGRLAPHLKAGGAFVAIGAAHLTGPRSVIELLRARGWKITRVP